MKYENMKFVVVQNAKEKSGVLYDESIDINKYVHQWDSKILENDNYKKIDFIIDKDEIIQCNIENLIK